MSVGHSHTLLGNLTKETTGRLALSLGITLAFIVVEVAAGLIANSLALLADAAHNLTDVVALALSWYAVRLAKRPASSGKTFGYHRAGILVALINSTTLILIAIGIFYGAYRRLITPPQVKPAVLIAVGLVAFLVNFGTAWLIKKGSEHDLNIRSAFLHLMGDVFSAIGAVLAGVIIAFTGRNWLDPLVSILIGVLILWNAWGIVRETVDILLEGTPRDIDMSNVVRDLLAIERVRDVHDLHVWSITRRLRALSVHIVIDDISIGAGAQIQSKVNEMLRHKYQIAHATLQLECSGCHPDLLYCAIQEGHEHNLSHL